MRPLSPRRARARAGCATLLIVGLLAACESGGENGSASGDAAADADTRADAGMGDVSDSADVEDVAADAPAARACNGHAALCERRFDEVVLAGTHNSMSARDEEFFAPNQEHGIAQQLDEGIRALMIDTYRWRGATYFCHGGCEIGATPADEGLAAIADFLEANPNEVIAIIFENAISAAESAEILRESGLAELALTPPQEGEPWPTLGEMIDSGERALFTLERGEDAAWLPNAWTVLFDTPYTFASVDEFSCAVNRGSDTNGLYLINHWVQDPITRPDLAAVANARDVLLARVSGCEEATGRLPNILAVDFYDLGDLLGVVDTLNGVDGAAPLP